MLGMAMVQDLPLGSTVTVYNAQGDGTAAVADDGTVAGTATLAYVYADRAGVTILANPATPTPSAFDLSRLGYRNYYARPGTSFSFFAFPGVYHLLVVMPNGQRFGIPYVRAPFEAATWCSTDMHASHTKITDETASVVKMRQLYKAGTDMTDGSDSSFSALIQSGVGAANAAYWAGSAGFVSASLGSDPYISNSSETGVQGAWGRLAIVETNLTIELMTNPTTTMITGIGLGINNATPIAANPTVPLVLLYANCSALTWNLFTAKGSGSGNTASQLCTGAVPDPNVKEASERLRLHFNPNAGVIEAFINGGFAGRIVNAAAKLPARGFAGVWSPVIFGQSGSNAGGAVSSCFFHFNSHIGKP